MGVLNLLKPWSTIIMLISQTIFELQFGPSDNPSLQHDSAQPTSNRLNFKKENKMGKSF